MQISCTSHNKVLPWKFSNILPLLTVNAFPYIHYGKNIRLTFFQISNVMYAFKYRRSHRKERERDRSIHPSISNSYYILIFFFLFFFFSGKFFVFLTLILFIVLGTLSTCKRFCTNLYCFTFLHVEFLLPLHRKKCVEDLESLFSIYPDFKKLNNLIFIRLHSRTFLAWLNQWETSENWKEDHVIDYNVENNLRKVIFLLLFFFSMQESMKVTDR